MHRRPAAPRRSRDDQRARCRPAAPAARLLARPLLAAGLLAALLLAPGPLAPLAWAAPPPPPPPSAAEAAALAAREVVVATHADGWTVVMVDVDAPPDAAFAAVLDMPARVRDIDMLREATVYLDEPSRLGVAWRMGVAGVDVRFHTLYAVDRAGRWCTYALDPARDNDLDAAAGSYQVVDLGQGRSRIVYLTRAEEDGAPSWIRRMLQQKGTRNLLGGMRDRAEAGQQPAR